MTELREVSKTNDEREIMQTFAWDENNANGFYEKEPFRFGLSILKRNLPYSYAEWRLEAEQYGLSPHKMWALWAHLVKVAKVVYLYESQDSRTSIYPTMNRMARDKIMSSYGEDE